MFIDKACITVNFPLRIAFAATHKFCTVVFSLSLVSRYFYISSLISSLTTDILMTYIISLHVITIFSFLFLWLISCFMPLWLEKILEIISIILNLLRLVFCPNMWLILENVPCALEYVFWVFFGCNVLNISFESNCTIVSRGICCTTAFQSRSAH